MSDLPKPTLDHVVINVAAGLDEAAALYERLGFSLTERGHHTLGSSNNLAIFPDTYLELLGFLLGRPQQRADLWGHPLGLTGLVFRSHDPDLVHAALTSAGVEAAEPMHFSRPVDLPGAPQDAKFAVVRLSPNLVPNGRIFFCHHYTRDLVWRPEWQDHPNGARDVVEFVIAARDPSASIDIHRRMFGADAIGSVEGGFVFLAGAARVSILTPDVAKGRFGEALPPLPEDGSDRMVALVFGTSSLAKAEAALAAGRIGHRPFEGRILVDAADAANVALAFRP